MIPFALAGVGGVLKEFLGFLFSKTGLILLAVVLIFYGEYRLWKHGVQTGVEKTMLLVTKAKKELQDFKDEKKRQEDAAKVRAEAIAKKQAAVVSGLKERLDNALGPDGKPRVVVKTKEVIRYVSKEADAACTIPVGFVQLYNAGATGLAPGGPENADAPSGVTLSTLADTDQYNLAECRARGEIIEAWQSWYGQNKAIFDKYKDMQP